MIFDWTEALTGWKQLPAKPKPTTLTVPSCGLVSAVIPGGWDE